MKLLSHVTSSLALLVAAVLFTMSQASAGTSSEDRQFSYTYAQLGGGIFDTSNDGDGSVFEGRAVIGLGKYVYLRAEAAQLDDSDFDTTTTNYSGAVGFHKSFTEQLDFMVDAGYSNANVEVGSFDTNFDGPIVGIGLRGFSHERVFEAEARYAHRWYDAAGKTEDNGNFRFDMVWHITNSFGMYAGGTWETDGSEDTVGTYALGLRVTL